MSNLLTKDNNNTQQVKWPEKFDLFGVNISATQYDLANDLIISSARQGIPAIVTHLPVHGVVLASKDPSFRQKINNFEIIAPDGHPVRWALNYFYGTRLCDRVYGPELMSRLCHRAADSRIGIYLFGSHRYVLDRLIINLKKKYPNIKIAGSASPPFRPLTIDEDNEAVESINRSGAGIIFLGLGCPLQDEFAYEHRNRIKAVQVCVGAAFDFLAANKKMAPGWMQKRGLEWFFRLTQEPQRLWRRYLFTNTIFILLFIKRIISRSK